jgi:hypothetical protein
MVRASIRRLHYLSTSHASQCRTVDRWSCCAYPSFANVRATIQESNDARPLGDAPSRKSSRDWNGTLAAYCHMTPVEQNQNEKQKDTVSGMGATKAVIGNCIPLTHSLFVSDIPRR